MSNNTQPEIRFPGFTEDWEQRKLGDFIDVKSGKDYKHLNSGSIPVYGTGGYMLSVDRALSDIDAIGIGRKGTIDKPYLLKAPFWTVDTLFYAVPKQNIDLQFSLSIFKKINWKKFDESTGVPSLSKTVINSVGASVPSYEEQQKIGSFFKQLDETIALHQRKLDLLKETKKGFLQKMFPKNGAKVPEIRFPGFTKDWEQRKLGDFVVDYVEKTSVQNQFPMLTSSQQKGIVLQEDYFANRQVTTENNIGYFVLPRGYFTFRSRSDNDVFVFNRNDIIDRGIISYFYPVFTLKSADSDFFLRRINNGIQRQLSIQAEGTGQHVLSLKKFKNIVAMFPSEEEQQKIGTFFKQLDDTITLHQRKLDLLKETKKGFLQKMFV
ncbi:restriction endonuclease subunit S [Enterococcus hirae]|nr:restriction endonuclease subunit S [Enterococcus hirae]EMF0197992.1 restriction endonuclease subunit S [Enterococcus hirae]EMF0463625.1 restriction endonuclease subunit S [Enterococcus hirae]